MTRSAVTGRLRRVVFSWALLWALGASPLLAAEPTFSAAEEGSRAKPMRSGEARRGGSRVSWARTEPARLGARRFVGPSFDGVLPEWVQSVQILAEGEPLFAAPASRAARRGAATLGARLPVYAVRAAPGCQGAWFHVGPEAWVCETGAEPSPHAPLSAEDTHEPPAHGLPHSYYFVGALGSFGYRDLARAELGTPDAQLEPGFAVALLRKRARSADDPFGLTSHGLWVPLRDVHPARPSLFTGVDLGAEPLAWTLDADTPAYDAPGGRLVRRLPRRSELRVAERTQSRGKAWLRTREALFVEEKRVARMRPASLPLGLAHPRERWLDVDVHEQVLTAYEGDRPVFATLVSTGRGSGTSEEATPLGEHRVWVKLISSDMDNLEKAEAARYYSMQSVPWVMYFQGGYGLHGAFWHDDFGRKRSHGCVNLTPRDAARLFSWTSPRLPAGWSAVLPTRYEPGTLVRVRDSSARRDPRG